MNQKAYLSNECLHYTLQARFLRQLQIGRPENFEGSESQSPKGAQLHIVGNYCPWQPLIGITRRVPKRVDDTTCIYSEAHTVKSAKVTLLDINQQEQGDAHA